MECGGEMEAGGFYRRAGGVGGADAQRGLKAQS